MTLRCCCSDDERWTLNGGWRDPIVFGPCQRCHVPRERPYESTLSDGDGDLG